MDKKMLKEHNECCAGETPKPKTNYERIKAMTIEEMAEFLPATVSMGIVSAYCFVCKEANCSKCIKQWLEKEVQE